jgi:hypothetical protein
MQRSKIRLGELDAEQQSLAAEEKFEEADEINGQMDALREETLSMNSQLDMLGQEEKQYELRLSKYSTTLGVQVNQILAQFESIRKAQEEAVISAQAENAKALKDDDRRLCTEEERVAMEKSHIEREESALLEEEQSTESAIASQSGDLLSRREETQNDLDAVGSEIEELERQLQIKRIEQNRLQKELEQMDGRVNEVRKKYDRQLQRIRDRSSAVSLAKAECEVEERQVTAEREAYLRRVRDADDKVLALQEWCGKLDAEIPIVEMVNMSLQMAGSDRGSESETDALKAPTELKCAQSVADAALAAALAEQSAVKQALDALTSELADVDEKLPGLEAEKKAHAAAKRFKEAAVVAKETKALQARKEEIDSDVCTKSEMVLGLARRVEECMEKRSQAAEALRDAKRDSAIVRFQSLLSQMAVLRKAQRAISKELQSREQQNDERSIHESNGAHTETTNGNSSSNSEVSTEKTSLMLQPMIVLLHSELENVLAEATDLKTEYNLPESLDVGIADEAEMEMNGEDQGDAATELNNGSDLGSSAEDAGAANQSHDQKTSPTKPENDADVGADADADAKDFKESPCKSDKASLPTSPATNDGVGIDDAPGKPACDDSDSNEVDDVMQSQLDKEAAEAAEAAEKARLVCIQDAYQMSAEIDRLASELDTATELEEYEQAAELDEAMQAMQIDLDSALKDLDMSLEDLKAMRI